MIGAVVCLVVGLTPGTASAQSCYSGGEMWSSGTQRVTGKSYLLGDCGGDGVYVGTWFIGRTSNVLCGEGAVYVGNGHCRNVGSGQTEIFSSTKFNGCGYYSARSRHYAWAISTGQIWWDVYLDYPYQFGYSCQQTEEFCDQGEVWVEPEGCVPYNSPIIVPLTRSQDYHLTSVSTGVQFDMDGNGVKEQTAWTAPGSRLAFLAMDRNGNGVIDDGRELFGNHTIEQKSNGFEVLIALAIANDGTPPKQLVAGHPVFDALLLWEDRNHNGISEPSEIQSASNVVSEVGLGYEVHNRRDRFGNQFRFQGWASVRTAPGKNPTVTHENMVERNIKLYDVFFRGQ